MRSRVHAVLLPSEISDFADEVDRLFAELDRALGTESLTSECSPAVDVFETDETVEIVVDLPGVDPAAVRLVLKGNGVLVAGYKAPRRARRDASFHLVERGFGRFARTIRIVSPCDTHRTHATLANGELRVSVPKLVERRGRPITVPIHSTGEPRPS